MKKQVGPGPAPGPLGVAFIFVPPRDPLLFLRVVAVFFIVDLPLFFGDLYGLVSGDAIVVPRASEESTQLQK